MNQDHVLTPDQMEIVYHAIGMTRSNYRRTFGWWWNNDKHRNHYATDERGPGFEVIRGLVEKHLMVRGQSIPPGVLTYYHATDAGITMAKSQFPKKATRD